MKLQSILLLSVIIITLFSCKAPTDVVYFQNTKNLEQVTSNNSFTRVFKVDDIISIMVSATNMEAARPFNLMQGSSLSTTTEVSDNAMSSSSNSPQPTYLIDEQGNIDFPVLGKIKVAGMTRVQVKEMLQEKLKIYIKDPIVNVRLKNFKITVIGEINRPGSYNIPNERITIIEALGMAGDMTITGKRTNVMVIRENDGVNTYHKVDLTSKDIFDSPAYYLAQNDVLYVEPNNAQQKRSRTNSNTFGIVLSIVGVVLSSLTLILR
ncbi:polysaccharide biosynthesis/export family protein [Aquimarina sp. W85]|uniref:polysaccharide biosynthesis/export family protein n=1 Tax=Aquimarina rhodophyticola TaxID=3342246 RepID=UPI00366DE2B3